MCKITTTIYDCVHLPKKDTQKCAQKKRAPRGCLSSLCALFASRPPPCREDKKKIYSPNRCPECLAGHAIELQDLEAHRSYDVRREHTEAQTQRQMEGMNRSREREEQQRERERQQRKRERQQRKNEEHRRARETRQREIEGVPTTREARRSTTPPRSIRAGRREHRQAANHANVQNQRRTRADRPRRTARQHAHPQTRRRVPGDQQPRDEQSRAIQAQRRAYFDQQLRAEGRHRETPAVADNPAVEAEGYDWGRLLRHGGYAERSSLSAQGNGFQPFEVPGHYGTHLSAEVDVLRTLSPLTAEDLQFEEVAIPEHDEYAQYSS
ncbi:hypothetical protein G7046_g1917 [Stylonectria norvegica]|nr:hypothetical protein G7046_g1917 [Stylonectria norvegica]